jgi:hypothetical protein
MSTSYWQGTYHSLIYDSTVRKLKKTKAQAQVVPPGRAKTQALKQNKARDQLKSLFEKQFFTYIVHF